MPEETVIAANPKKLARLAALAVLMTLLSLWAMIFNGMQDDSSVLAGIAGAAGFLFFGWCLVWILRLCLGKKPLLILNKDGLTDRSSSISLGLLPWSSVTDAFCAFFASREYLCLEIADYEERKKALSPLKRLLIAANGKMGLPPVCISLALTDLTAGEAVKLVKRFRQGQDSPE